MKIQVNSGTGWATYEKDEGEAVAQAFRELGMPVEVREVPSKKQAPSKKEPRHD